VKRPTTSPTGLLRRVLRTHGRPQRLGLRAQVQQILGKLGISASCSRNVKTSSQTGSLARGPGPRPHRRPTCCWDEATSHLDLATVGVETA
jgi:hypothetical protein